VNNVGIAIGELSRTCHALVVSGNTMGGVEKLIIQFQLLVGACTEGLKNPILSPPALRHGDTIYVSETSTGSIFRRFAVHKQYVVDHTCIQPSGSTIP
jgi:hypothetical protein